jgi:anti-sigma B factor antagonist
LQSLSSSGFAAIGREGGLRLIGELDLATGPALRAALQEIDGHDIVLDCSGLTFIDCSGLRVLIEAHHRCATDGLSLTVQAPSGCLTRLLELIGLDGWLSIDAASPAL